jgi:murein DD-endopeptidase MepM/ murein hydrolase activator NlpD
LASGGAGHTLDAVRVFGPIQAKLASAPNDTHEQEANRVADEVMRMPEPGAETSAGPDGPPAGLLQAKRQPSSTLTTPPTLEATLAGHEGRGAQLTKATRGFFEPRFGHDFGRVRIHADGEAADAAQRLGAQAFTRGRDIYFAAGRFQPHSAVGQRLVAHELAHVVQQAAIGDRVQRYEAGEHAQLGETQEELKKAFGPSQYTVAKGDSLASIAKKFGLSVAELKDANKTSLKTWPAADGSAKMVEGFAEGATVSIPQKLNELANAAIKDTSVKVTVNGVVLDYGVAIAMGDLFESRDQMAKASPKELKALADLINRERSGGKPVTTEEWEKATGGRYLELAKKNEAHFAPPNPSLVTPSSAGAASPNHKSEWEKQHKSALDTSKSGDKDMALMTNAYGDHFLTDAFSAGHLFNKRDQMELFKGQLKLDPEKLKQATPVEEFDKDSKKFFDEVAKDAFTGSVKTEFSKYETVETFYGVHADIDRESRFSGVLQGIQIKKPELLANAVAKGVHDTLNTIPGGVPVENAKGDPPWSLSGDGTLNTETKAIARKAVAQSQVNVISAYKSTAALAYSDLYKKVWDYTPRLRPDGAKQVVKAVTSGTDIKSAVLKKSVVQLIKDNYKLIIEKLVIEEKKLQKIK